MSPKINIRYTSYILREGRKILISFLINNRCSKTVNKWLNIIQKIFSYSRIKNHI